MKRNAAVVFAVILVAVGGALHAGEVWHPDFLATYLKGAYLESKNDLIHAYSYYMYAHRFDRENRWIQLRLAHVTLELGDLNKARTYAEQVLASGRYQSEAGLVLADIEYRQGNTDAALDQLSALVDLEGVSRIEVMKFIARIHLETGDIAQARQTLEDARELSPDDFYINYRLGFIYTEAEEIDQALEAFERAVKANPGFANAHLVLASLLRHKGRTEEAITHYRRAISLEPTNRTALGELVEILVATGEFSSGIEILEPLYRQDSLDLNGALTLGRFYYREGMVDEALEVFEDLLEREGERPTLLRIVAEVEMERGNLRTAYRYLERLVGIEPENFANYVGLVLISHDLAGDATVPAEMIVVPEAEAQRLLSEAVRLMDRESADDNYLIGAVYRKIERYDLAEDYLLAAERLAPGERRILLEIATLYEALRRYEEALKRVVFLYEKDPADASLCNFYGYLLAEQGEQLEFAEKLLTHALDQEPENGYFLDSLGWIKFKQGNYDAALSVLKDALLKSDDDAVIWEHLADTYVKLGLVEEALEAYGKSLDIDPGNEEVRLKREELQASSEK